MIYRFIDNTIKILIVMEAYRLNYFVFRSITAAAEAEDDNI